MSNKKEILFSHDFFGLVAELEVALCIDGEDYNNRDVDLAINKIKQRLQRQYSIDLTSESMNDVYSTSILGDEVKIFIDNMFYLYGKLCGISHYFRYTASIPISLSKINYLGITKESMLGVLKMAQCEGKQKTLTAVMEQIKSKIGTVPMSIEKKLFMIFYVSYILEIHELVASIAEILYIGGL